jgi:hypothetical protein
VGSAGLATTAGVAASAGLAGYGIGTLINKGIGRAFEHFSEGKYKGKGAIGQWLYDVLHKKPDPQKVGGVIRLEVESREPVRVRDMEPDAAGIDFDIDTGPMM